MLKLSRPLVFFDLESTGVDVFNDRIVQIAVIKIFPDGHEEEKEWLVNPGMPIPPGATEIHGITDEMVQNAPSLGDLAQELAGIFDNADMGGYNVKNFDIPMLAQEFSRIGLELDVEGAQVVDSMGVFRVKEPRNLTAAYAKYCGKELEDAHTAMADTRASLDVLYGQMNYYDDLPDDVAGLHELCFPKDPDAYDAEGKIRFVGGELTINFGKNKGKQLKQLALTDPGYLEWIMNGSFSAKVKEAVGNALKGR